MGRKKRHTEDFQSERKRAKVLQVSQEREEHEERFSTATVKSLFYSFTVPSTPWTLWLLLLFFFSLCARILMLRLRCSLDNICVIHNFSAILVIDSMPMWLIWFIFNAIMCLANTWLMLRVQLEIRERIIELCTKLNQHKLILD